MKKCCWLLVLLVCLAATQAWAAGFRIPEQGVAAMGMSNAWVAQADDPTAVFMNPAGIVQMETPAVAGGLIAILPSTEHKGVSGGEWELESQTFFTPNLFATCPMGSKNWAFGIGVSTPFGLGTEWAADSFAKYSSTETEIQLFNVNPTLAFKAGNNFSLGFGADYYNSKVTIKKKIPVNAIAAAGILQNPLIPPAMVPGLLADALVVPDGDFALEGDGDGWGWNLGALFKPTPAFSFGIAYRSKVKVEYEGDASFTNILVPEIKALFPDTTGTAAITYPDMLQVGMAVKATPALTVEVDLDWTDWSHYRDLTVNFAQPVLRSTQSTALKDWKETICFRVGMDYKLNPRTDLRAGYLYDTSPIGNEHFDTLLPDGRSRHGVSLGLGYDIGRFKIDAAYLFLVQTEREITQDNPQLLGPLAGAPLPPGLPDALYSPYFGGTDIRGTYEGTTHLLGIELSYYF